jgi:hypothetical protein
MVVDPEGTSVSAPEIEAWKMAHRRVLLETDANKLPALAHELEHSLFIRAQQLDTSLANDVERHEMQLASDDLLYLKTNKLGWPSPQ